MLGPAFCADQRHDHAIAGTLCPKLVNLPILTKGPDGDGAIALLGLNGHGFEELIGSKVLDTIAPEVKILGPA